MSGTWTGSSVMAVRPTTPSPLRIIARPAGSARPPGHARCTNCSAASSYSKTMPPSSPESCDGPRHDGGEHRLQVERRGDRLPDLAERGELPDRALELGRARLQLGEQPRVLDGDDRLVGEGLEQRDLCRR